MKKFARLLSVLLLVSIAFGSLHAFVYAHEHTACGVHEFVAEQDAPGQCGDELCTIHFVFHQSFVLPETPHIAIAAAAVYEAMPTHSPHASGVTFFLLKPPIA